MKISIRDLLSTNKTKTLLGIIFLLGLIGVRFSENSLPRGTYARALYSLGLEYAAKDKTSQAIRCFKKAISQKPDFAWPYYELGNQWAKRFDYKNAIANYKKAIFYSLQSHAMIYYLSGMDYWFHKDYPNAIYCFETAAKITSNHDLSRYALGRIFHQLGDLQKEIGHLQLAVRVNPVYVEAHFCLAQAYARCGDWEYVEREIQELKNLGDWDRVEILENMVREKLGKG